MEWKVDTHIAFARRPTSAATRSRISAAALLVNVMARICPGCAPWASCQAMRWVSTRVLPEPGARDDEQRRAGVHHGLALLRVHPLEQRLSACSRRRSPPAAPSGGPASGSDRPPGGRGGDGRARQAGGRRGAPAAPRACRQPAAGEPGPRSDPVSVLLIAGHATRHPRRSGACPDESPPRTPDGPGARPGPRRGERPGLRSPPCTRHGDFPTGTGSRCPWSPALSRCPPPAPESEDPGAFSCRGPDGSDPPPGGRPP